MADNDMGTRVDCSLIVMVKFFLFKKNSRFDFKSIGIVFNKFHRRYIITDTVEHFKLLVKTTFLDWIKYKVFKIISPIFLWSIGYKTFNDYIVEIERRYEEKKYDNSRELEKAVVDRLFGDGE